MVSPSNFAQVRDSNNIHVHSHVTITHIVGSSHGTFPWPQRESNGNWPKKLQMVLLSFSFPDRHRGHIMKLAPCVWIEDLEQKIVDTLE